MPRYSSDEMKEMRRLGKSQTDLARAKAMTDEEISAAIATDPELAGLPDDWHETARLVVSKQPVSIRLDTDLVEYFRGTGRGWQTRINNVLRAYKEAMGQ